jgi:adenine-specific DNA methylase
MLSIQSQQPQMTQAVLPFELPRPAHRPCFPETKYMGSKQVLLPFILRHISSLRFNRALDAFSGSGCVAYALKQHGAEVHTNDFLRFAFHIGRSTVENNSILLDDCDVATLLRPNRNAQDFIERTFADRYFPAEDNQFLDNLWANVQELRSPVKRSLALAGACRAAMKKRPRGIFTFTGMKGWDGRKDLRMSMRDQFLSAVCQFNGAIFSNRRKNKAMCKDIFTVDPKGYDLVYIDPPYVSRFSDCDYTRRYHFVEGYCSYWKDSEILSHTLTKKIRSYRTDFSTKARAFDAFTRLFDHFRNSTLVISYSSNGIPSEKQMIDLLKNHKRKVEVHKIPHLYSHGNHNHKVGDNNNSVHEYLFIAK